MHARHQAGVTIRAHPANHFMFHRHCEGNSGGAVCGSSFFIERLRSAARDHLRSITPDSIASPLHRVVQRHGTQPGNSDACLIHLTIRASSSFVSS